MDNDFNNFRNQSPGSSSDNSGGRTASGDISWRHVDPASEGQNPTGQEAATWRSSGASGSSDSGKRENSRPDPWQASGNDDAYGQSYRSGNDSTESSGLGNSSMNAGSSGNNAANTGYSSDYGYRSSYTAGGSQDSPQNESRGYTGMQFDDGFGQYQQDDRPSGMTGNGTGYTDYSSSYTSGQDYSGGYSSGNYYGGGNGGNGFGHGGGKRSAAAGRPLYITRRTLILLLILCMVLTSALTFGGIMLYNKTIYGGDNSATHYKLAKSTETLSYKSIIEKTQDSVVSITTSSVSTDGWAQNYVTEGAGSGVIIQSNGYIMTCNHVIEGASKIKVTLRNKKSYTAKVVGADSDNDIAVLKINAVGLTPATYGDSSKLSVGDSVVAIGNPLGELSNTATTGIISALNRNLNIDGKKMNLLQTDASINPGNSGGALFNSSGNLIGIVVAKSTGSDVEGLGFAIPINRAAKVAKTLIKTHKGANGTSTSSTPTIGISVVQLSASEAKQNGLDGAGVYVASVTSSNAKRAGFKVSDRIISADGTVIRSYDKLKSVLKKHKSGDKIKVIVARDGKSVTLTTTLG
ncbi:MAG: trypsin-like peptidase domain-containing protein [Eubacterium sp.]|jgi:serine protease Do|nr:trypsin-like peptidase domain-containing protein [Eubacterium sp.]MCI2197987.1 trypsin-like peptidase domain-containing protein [Eubacterium sp.]